MFEDISDPFEVGRYHSLAVDRENLPDVLTETAYTVSDDAEAAAVPESADAATADGTDESQVVMGVRHREQPACRRAVPPREHPHRPGKTMSATSPLALPRDGTLVPEDEATVSVRDRGFMYGDAAFETLRAYGGEPFRWDAHRERLQRTAETLGFADAVPEDLGERVDETLAANDLEEAYVRLSVTRGVQPGKLTPGADVDPTVVVICKELPRGGLDGERVWDEPASAQTVRTRRIPARPSSGREDPQLPQRDPRPARSERPPWRRRRRGAHARRRRLRHRGRDEQPLFRRR